MKKTIPFLLWAAMWSVTGPVAAEDRILRLQVVNVAGVPQARLLIGLAGEGTYQSTDQQGNARIPLPAQTRVGDLVMLRLSNATTPSAEIGSPAAKRAIVARQARVPDQPRRRKNAGSQPPKTLPRSAAKESRSIPP